MIIQNTRKCMLFAIGCFCLLPSAYLHCKNMRGGGFVLILKSAWDVLSMLYFWAWGVVSAFQKHVVVFVHIYQNGRGVFLSVGCFVLHSKTVAPSRHDLKIGDWDVQPQYKQTNLWVIIQ